MSVRTIAIILDHSPVASSGERLLLVVIADKSGDDGVAWPSISEMARKALLSERQIKRLIASLVDGGHLQKRKAQRGRRRVSVYRLSGVSGLKSINYEDLPFKLGVPFDEVTSAAPSHEVTPEADEVTSTRARPSVSDQKAAKATSEKLLCGGLSRVGLDALWDAMVEEIGHEPQTKSEKSRFAKSRNELAAAGATSPEVKRRARLYCRKYEGAALTDRALVNHWGEFTPRRLHAVKPPCSSCGIGGGQHAADCETLKRRRA